MKIIRLFAVIGTALVIGAIFGACKPESVVVPTITIVPQNASLSQAVTLQNSRYKSFLVNIFIPFIEEDDFEYRNMLNLTEFQTTFAGKMDEGISGILAANPNCNLHSKEVLYMNTYLYGANQRGYAIQLPSGMYVILDCNK